VFTRNKSTQQQHKMKRIITSIVVFTSLAVYAGGNSRITKAEYVDRWSPVAVEQMIEHGIPASITLAQGILESANGNSLLATKGNNHFGIKCHGWDGKKMYKDDDRANECFRVYESADASFQDHSAFLKKYKRYAFLFDYASDDYKSWAKGLKKAGYATNPKYPQLLIDIIEDLKLYEYDGAGVPSTVEAPLIVVAQQSGSNAHQVMMHERGVKYITAKKGDTFYKIAQEYDLTLSQLYRFNDFASEKDFLEVGDVVYIQAKKRARLFKKEEVTVSEDITLHELSQLYAVNMESIKRLNDFTEDNKVIAKGEKVTLR